LEAERRATNQRGALEWTEDEFSFPKGTQ
jgi:hypothetical protein